jgi:hypothetical protein
MMAQARRAICEVLHILHKMNFSLTGVGLTQ